MTCFRPLSFSSMTFGQLLVMYEEEHEQGDRVPTTSTAIPVCTPDDCPAPSPSLILPARLFIDGGPTMRRRSSPRFLDWAPKNGYAKIVLFQVAIQYDTIKRLNYVKLSLTS